jgi:hypothetical protein
MTATTTDYLGYTVVADGVDAGRYATTEVAVQSYADEVHGLISDLSKDATGYRCRMDFSDASFFQMEMEADYWASLIEEELTREDRAAEENLQAFMQYAPDEETAKRWAQESL